MLGPRIRQARQTRQLSLNEVATKAKISVATLSRIERDKQGIDLGMFMTLSRILKAPVYELLGVPDESENGDALASRISSLTARDRITLWRDLATERSKDRAARKVVLAKVAEQVDELLAQIEFLHSEIESVQKRLRTRR